jgi:hypothetical protein
MKEFIGIGEVFKNKKYVAIHCNMKTLIYLQSIYHAFLPSPEMHGKYQFEKFPNITKKIVFICHTSFS